jgi:hypothetical protein
VKIRGDSRRELTGRQSYSIDKCVGKHMKASLERERKKLSRKSSEHRLSENPAHSFTKTILISSYFHSGAILNITILLTRSELGGSKRTIKILCPHKHAFYALFAWLLCRTSLGFSFFLQPKR